MTSFEENIMRTRVVDEPHTPVDRKLRGKHGFDKRGYVQHRNGCYPRAISMVYGKRLGLSYKDIVDVCYKSAAVHGNVFDFGEDHNDECGIDEMVELEVSLRLKLRLIILWKAQSLRDVVKFWPTCVAGQKTHALPIVNGKQLPNPYIDQRPSKIHTILTTKPYLWGA